MIAITSMLTVSTIVLLDLIHHVTIAYACFLKKFIPRIDTTSPMGAVFNRGPFKIGREQKNINLRVRADSTFCLGEVDLVRCPFINLTQCIAKISVTQRPGLISLLEIDRVRDIEPNKLRAFAIRHLVSRLSRLVYLGGWIEIITIFFRPSTA